MAHNLIVAIPGRALPLVRTDQKTREPMTMAQRVKQMLGITTWSELTKGDEPYFGF